MFQSNKRQEKRTNNVLFEISVENYLLHHTLAFQEDVTTTILMSDQMHPT